MAPHIKQECNQEENIGEMKAKICHIDKTLFFGNGKPSLVTQFEVMAEKMDSVTKKLETIESIGKALILAILSLIGATLWGMMQKYYAEKQNVSNQHTVKMETKGFDY